MSELRLVPRLRCLGIGTTLVLGMALYACGDKEVFGPPDDFTETPKRDAGNPVFTDSGPLPFQEAAAPRVLPPSSVTLGDGFSCLVAKDRAVYCWGRNDFGQLGSDPAKTASCGSYPCTPLPTKVEGLPLRIATVRAGKDFACALDEGEQVWCWGNNSKGQILGGTVASRFTPEKVAERAAQVDAAGQHACFLTNEGFLICWGDNACPLFGRPDAGAVVDARQVGSLPSQVSFSLGADQMCTVAEDSSVLCWGADHKGSLGHPVSGTAMCNGLPFDPVPKRVSQDGPVITFTGAAEVHVGLGLACVRTTTNKVMCWGDNSHGGLGQGLADSDTHAKPIAVPELETTTLAVGGETGCAVVADRLLCWGDARYGQLDSLGAGTSCGGSGCRPLGYVVPGQQPLKAIAVGASGIATIKSDSSLWVWGKNDSAETGASSSESGNVTCAGSSKCIPTPRMLTTAPALE